MAFDLAATNEQAATRILRDVTPRADARLPANLLQSLRDCFGAHTYHRTDKPGTFHTEWMK